MRTWESSITAWIAASLDSVIRSLSARVGVTAKVTTSAPSTAKSSSGISGCRLTEPGGPPPQVLEEAADQLPDLGTARKAAPAGADQTDQFEAPVDRSQVVV